MTNPIPRAARPVVWFIRWWVKKPRTLPGTLFPEAGNELAWQTKSCRVCPLGFIPEQYPLPRPEWVDIGLPLPPIRAFITWWDSQTDARAAVDAVWGAE